MFLSHTLNVRLQHQHRSVQDKDRYAQLVCMHQVLGDVAVKVTRKTVVQ